MSDFKVGDLVVCVEKAHPLDKYYPLVVGQSYKVIDQVFYSGRFSVKVEGLDGYWSVCQFKHFYRENV